VRHPSIPASRLPFLERWAVRPAAPAGPVDQHGAAASRPLASKGQVLFVSRQRIVGRTNGSSAYLLDLASAVRRAGFTPHLLQPAPDLMGRWPVMRLRPEMNTFETHEIRGVLRLGTWVLARDPRVRSTPCAPSCRALAGDWACPAHALPTARALTPSPRPGPPPIAPSSPAAPPAAPTS
jgi:hypothetical protein